MAASFRRTALGRNRITARCVLAGVMATGHAPHRIWPRFPGIKPANQGPAVKSKLEAEGLVADMAGPQVLSFADLVRMYLSATGHRPGPGAEPTLGRRSWLDFLAGKPAGNPARPGRS